MATTPTERVSIPGLGTLRAGNALYSVDLEQRIVQWGDLAEQIAPRHVALGRTCYELMNEVNPSNAASCRANCAVIALARLGRAHRDFTLRGRPVDGVTPLFDISVLLTGDDEGAVDNVLHLVRCSGVERRPMPATRSGEGLTLTARQLEVLCCLARGQTPAQIAAELGVTPITVRNHVQAAMDRLGAKSRLEAVLTAMCLGLLPTDAEWSEETPGTPGTPGTSGPR